jgi:hypothetical protein
MDQLRPGGKSYAQENTQGETSDPLLKTHKKGEIELTEQELGKVTGGRKAGKDQPEFLKITLKDVMIT